MNSQRRRQRNVRSAPPPDPFAEFILSAVEGLRVTALAESRQLARSSPAHRRYRCRDGYLTVAVGNEGQWKALCKCLGRPELSYPGSWEAASAAAPRGRLGRLLEGIFVVDPVEVWLERLRSHGVPCGRAN